MRSERTASAPLLSSRYSCMASLHFNAPGTVFKQLSYALGRPCKRRRLSTAAVAPPFRILLLGADDFSCATLRALHEAREGE